jgi:hypothetical protein
MSSDDEPVKHEVKENTGHGLYCFNSSFTGSFFSGHGIYCFTSLTGSSLLGMISTVSLPSLVHHYWEWFVFFHFMFHWFIITGHGLYGLTTSFTGSSLLGMVKHEVKENKPFPVMMNQ